MLGFFHAERIGWLTVTFRSSYWCVDSWPLQEVLREPQRLYLLSKARHLQDALHAINKCPGAAEAPTPADAKRKRYVLLTRAWI